MRIATASPLVIAGLLLAGCGGVEVLEEGQTAPYKALVVFEWPEGPEKDLAASGNGNGDGGHGNGESEMTLTREGFENHILDGLEDYRVFCTA